jgi:hypothetical protein
MLSLYIEIYRIQSQEEDGKKIAVEKKEEKEGGGGLFGFDKSVVDCPGLRLY